MLLGGKMDKIKGNVAGQAPKKRLLGIVCSMRKLGNCELFIKETARLIPEKHDLGLIRLPELAIKPCTGCYQCIITGTCSQKNDDVPFILQSIAEADALIIAAPVYFLGAHGSVKNLLDRGFSFYGSVEAYQGKPCIVACTHAMPDKVGVSTQALQTLAAILCLDIVASVRLHCALPGEVLKNQVHRRTAARLAPLLFGKRRPKRAGGCPFCGNDIVRMVKGAFICTLCHGRFSIEDGRTTRQKEGWPIGQPRFIGEHTEWLKGVKDRFLAEKKDLLRLSLPYKEMGSWLTPPSKDTNKTATS
jgi:NAD(P)H-dependent FMN reductase